MQKAYQSHIAVRLPIQMRDIWWFQDRWSRNQHCMCTLLLIPAVCRSTQELPRSQSLAVDYSLQKVKKIMWNIIHLLKQFNLLWVIIWGSFNTNLVNITAGSQPIHTCRETRSRSKVWPPCFNTILLLTINKRHLHRLCLNIS